MQTGPVELTLEDGLALATRACRLASERDLLVTIALTDIAGHLLALTRMDGAFPGSVEAAIAKARCAALYRRPTSAFAQGQRAGKPLGSLPGVIPLGGGVLLRRGAALLGALGISGALEETETELAEQIAADFAETKRGRDTEL